MLDTVKIRSPYLPETMARSVENHLERKTSVRVSDGEVLYDFTSGPLSGTWDHRVRLQVQREEWVCLDKLASRLGTRVDGRSRRPVLRKCPPYLEVEGSVHKQLLGHNVFGGPADLAPAVCWFVDHLGRQLGIDLPSALLWSVRRLDWAHVYDLGSVEAVQEFVSYLHNVKYPRRKVSRYEDESVMVAGTTSAVKLYHKGPEFQKHDHARVSRYADAGELQALANRLLRCEVEIHSRTLDEEFYPASPSVASVTVQWIESLHDRDLGRLLREGASDMRTVRNAAAVKRRLWSSYSERQARVLWGTWLELAAMGEAPVRGTLPRRTFYRHRKQLVDAGCSWHDTNVKLDDRVRLVPEDFVPLPHDPRCVDSEAAAVSEALAPYRRSA